MFWTKKSQPIEHTFRDRRFDVIEKVIRERKITDFKVVKDKNGQRMLVVNQS